jgi:hypothetical protein
MPFCTVLLQLDLHFWGTFSIVYTSGSQCCKHSGPPKTYANNFKAHYTAFELFLDSPRSLIKTPHAYLIVFECLMAMADL